MDAAVVQMNVRLDAELKAKGDGVLERVGLTPTKAVRALWERLASCSDRPEKVTELLMPQERPSDESEDAERFRKLRIAREGAQIVARSLAERGIELSSVTDDTPYEELRERVLVERLQERGLDR